MLLVVERTDPETGAAIIVAVGRLTPPAQPGRGRVLDAGARRLRGAAWKHAPWTNPLAFSRDEHIERVVAYMLPENQGMIEISEKLGFGLEREEDMGEGGPKGCEETRDGTMIRDEIGEMSEREAAGFRREPGCS